MKFSEKLVEANKVLDWAEEFFNKDVFTEYTNLKLHDICYNLKQKNMYEKKFLKG